MAAAAGSDPAHTQSAERTSRPLLWFRGAPLAAPALGEISPFRAQPSLSDGALGALLPGRPSAAPRCAEPEPPDPLPQGIATGTPPGTADKFAQTRRGSRSGGFGPRWAEAAGALGAPPGDSANHPPPLAPHSAAGGEGPGRARAATCAPPPPHGGCRGDGPGRRANPHLRRCGCDGASCSPGEPPARPARGDKPARSARRHPPGSPAPGGGGPSALIAAANRERRPPASPCRRRPGWFPPVPSAPARPTSGPGSGDSRPRPLHQCRPAVRRAGGTPCQSRAPWGPPCAGPAAGKAAPV